MNSINNDIIQYLTCAENYDDVERDKLLDVRIDLVIAIDELTEYLQRDDR